MRKIRVGVIGLGEVAQIIHLPILQALSDRYEIVAMCDISPTLLHLMGERYGVERCYTDAFELCRQPDVDAVWVLNSDEYHAECAVAAASSGKHVMIEKPMCLTLCEAEEIMRARDAAGVHVMVGYMRRYAPAFTRAVEEVRALGRINYARVRDIIGQNRLSIEQSSIVYRPDDFPPEALRDRAERASMLVREAIGEAPKDLGNTYRLLCGLSSHDLSAMRELLGGPPRRVISAARSSNGRFLSAIFEYDGYVVTFETGTDAQRRFDAHIEVYGETRSVRVQYDTPYIRHLPTTLHLSETVGDAYTEKVERPTYKDPYTHEIDRFYEVVTQDIPSKTTSEDSIEDLKLFRRIIDALRTGGE
ncbi:MAG: Gfo/Idh/MocA family oxidoreductase [Chloroflexota bacterium]|nr:Gfo/Idh/MocA family oxidoreductase [Chloroflexota bacterium]